MAQAAAQDFLLPVLDGQEDAPQILTFRLGQTVFGIDVRHVREVLDVTPITPVANAPASLVGMVDVRHEGVPVVDLKHKLRMGDTTGGGSDTRIVVLEIGAGDAPQVIAIIADAVLEVVEHDPATLESPPRFGEAWDASFIRGIGRRDQEFMTLLDIEAVFRPRDGMFDGG
ncbi:chemotaxis protein CheW [Paracoccus nototheniae]